MVAASIRLLVFDDELLSRTPSGAVWGRVYFEFDHQLFPGEGWSDLVVVFVAVWLEAVTRITTEASLAETVRFMDGPLAIHISTDARGSVRLEFTHKGVVKYSVLAIGAQLLQSAISAGQELVAICNRHGWSSGRDYSLLAANIDKAIRSSPV